MLSSWSFLLDREDEALLDYLKKWRSFVPDDMLNEILPRETTDMLSLENE